MLAAIGGKAKSSHAEALTADYLERAARMQPVDSTVFASEAKLLEHSQQLRKKGTVQLVLFDSRGALLTSEELAKLLQENALRSTQALLFAIGPADGWSPEALAAAAQTISFGRVTLPHELARVVAAEQIYRALTILNNHPYHGGH